jgi:anti-anti-sigma factor
MAANPISRAPELTLEIETKPTETMIRIKGRITLTSNDMLERSVRDLISEGKRIVLDLMDVDYIDSAGLGSLVSVYLHARRTKCALKIANPKQRIRDLFDRSGLRSVFEGDSFDKLWEAWSGQSD